MSISLTGVSVHIHVLRCGLASSCVEDGNVEADGRPGGEGLALRELCEADMYTAENCVRLNTAEDCVRRICTVSFCVFVPDCLGIVAAQCSSDFF